MQDIILYAYIFYKINNAKKYILYFEIFVIVYIINFFVVRHVKSCSQNRTSCKIFFNLFQNLVRISFYHSKLILIRSIIWEQKLYYFKLLI